MEEQVIITMSEKVLSGMRTRPGEIREHILQELLDNLDKIRLMISGYFFLERKRIYDLAIDEESLWVNQAGTGSFVARYTIGIFDGCADMDRSQFDSMNISVATNLKTGELIVSGENLRERQSDDL